MHAQLNLNPKSNRPLQKEKVSNQEEVISVKTDGAWRKDLGAAGLGWICSNQRLKIHTKHSASYRSIASPLMAEALAILHAIETAIEAKYLRIAIESDSLIVIKAINSGESISEIYGLLEDINSFKISFQFISFNVIPRAFNAEADTLAKQALSLLGQLSAF